MGIILAGESGGGNLCTAMALRAKRDGKLDQLDGVYSFCPFIAGPKNWKAWKFASMSECDGYFIDLKGFLAAVKCYDPEGKYDSDPCAWPLTAMRADMEGLPPHVVSV